MMAFFVGMDYWWCGWIWRRPLGGGLRRLVHEVIHPVVVVEASKEREEAVW